MPTDSLAIKLGPEPERIGDYEVVEELGRGAMSTVYRATRHGQAFAIKVMRESRSTSELDRRLQFRREAAAIARLRHPALVRVVEAGTHEDRPYLVMELARGETLAARLQRGRLDDGPAVALALSIARGLVEVHKYGLVHRDIKPANIIVQDDLSAKLIDFGMVAEASDSDEVAGTLLYSAPEQLGVLNRAVDAPADLYALGATVFEALVGRPPFVADSQQDLLHAVASAPAPLVTDEVATSSPALALIIDHLLRKDPDDRYQTASGLVADLERLVDLDEAIGSREGLSLNTHSGLGLTAFETPLIGRDAELTALREAWTRAKRGRGGFIQVTGEGGSGKTRLTQQLLTKGRADGALVLTGKCQENERTPFGPLREAADRHVIAIGRLPSELRRAAEERLRTAAGDDAALVRRLSTGMAQVLGDAGSIRPLEPGAEQQRYYLAIATFLSRLASAAQPVILVLDDVQWLDDGSTQVLGMLAEMGASTHMVVVSTCRTAETPPSVAYREAVASRALPPIELAPLGREAVGELIAARLGGRPLDPHTTQRLAELTHGNPYALGEYLSALLDRGVVQPAADGWSADPSALESVHLPDDVVALVLSRLEHLNDATSTLTEFAAIAGGRFTASELCRASGMRPEGVRRGLLEMSRAGLVGRSFDDSWSFHHDRAREAIIEGMPAERRRDVHHAFAIAMDDGSDLSASDQYTLARHYTGGHQTQAPDRVMAANLRAGLTALDEHAYPSAFDMLSMAVEVATRAGLAEGIADVALPALGRACAMTGRLDQAFEHLQNALPYAETQDERFRIHHLLTLTYASQGRNDEALAALFRSFDVIGRPFPRSRITQVAQLLITWFLAIFLRRTGIGHATATGDDRERRKVVSQLNYAGSMIALFQGDTLLMVQFIVRDFFNVHFLGATAETAIASTVYGAVLGTFRLKRTMRHYTESGVAMAEQLGDRAALAVCHAYQAMGHKWSGDLETGNRMLSEALPELSRFVPGSWYSAMMICEQAYSHLHAGRARAAIEHIKTYRNELNRTNNLMFRYNTFSVESCQTHVCGDVQPAARQWASLERQWPALAHTNYVRLAKSAAELEVLVDQAETGADVAAAIEVYAPVQGEDYYSNVFRLLVGYAHLAAVEHGPEAERPAARRRLKRAILALRLRAMVPVFSVHPHIWRAALARIDGRTAAALRHLDRATAVARRVQSPRADYFINLERAHLAAAAGDPVATFWARSALDLARAEGWRHKAQRVRKQFDLHEQRRGDAFAMTRAGTRVGSRAQDQAKRYADALLQVSLASASTLDSDRQAQLALNAVSRVLGSERALFFLFDEDHEALHLTAATGDDTEAYSDTVVQRVVETGEAVVVSGDDIDDLGLASDSILRHGLRSIMAAPLNLREKMIGVVYVDSRLAKGMFTEDDVSVLLAVSNHIAIAMETARSARLEAERTVLQKDMELVGVVQTLMLPKSNEFAGSGVSGSGYYQSATQCGGDWWWNQTRADGSVVLWMGDVSGHGAAPAMITSAIAGAFHTLCSLDPDALPDRIMAQLNERVAALGGGFHMTMTAVQIDAGADALRMWNAGGPAVFVQRAAGLQPLSARGSVLGGAGPFTVGRVESPFGPGDRLLMCTDGLLELRRQNGRELGARGVARMLRASADVPIADLPAHLGDTLNAELRGQAQEDDITFIVAERTPTTPSEEAP